MIIVKTRALSMGGLGMCRPHAPPWKFLPGAHVLPRAVALRRRSPLENVGGPASKIALVDVGLPGLDGYEVARRVRASEAGRTVRLVALTGYGLPEDHRRSHEAGFDTHLVKPVDAERLTAVIGAIGR